MVSTLTNNLNGPQSYTDSKQGKKYIKRGKLIQMITDVVTVTIVVHLKYLQIVRGKKYEKNSIFRYN